MGLGCFVLVGSCVSRSSSFVVAKEDHIHNTIGKEDLMLLPVCGLLYTGTKKKKKKKKKSERSRKRIDLRVSQNVTKAACRQTRPSAMPFDPAS